MQQEFTQTYFISANECNPEGELALTVLTGHLIEVATLHANSLGVGNPSMSHLGAGWVLSRLTIEMTRYPKADTSYSVKTWVEDWNRHYSTRNFEFIDSEGATVGYARSIWMVLNTRTHENFGTTHLNLSEDMVSGRKVPIDRQRRHIPICPEGFEGCRGALTETEPVSHYTFKYNDIDFYRHVNTVKYAGVIMNLYTLQDFDRYLPARLEMSFLREGKYGERVDIHASREDRCRASYSITEAGHPESPILFARLKLSPRK